MNIMYLHHAALLLNIFLKFFSKMAVTTLWQILLNILFSGHTLSFSGQIWFLETATEIQDLAG